GLAWACLHYLPVIQSNGSTVDPAQADRVTRSSASAQEHGDAKLNPLEGTAAAAWPTGGAGITLPTPRPVGEYSREVVRHAYAATRRYLVAAMLTDDVLYHGKVQPVLDGFPDSDQLAADYGDPHDDKAWSFIATRFRPGVYTPVGHTVKVRGWMKAVERNSELQVRYSYAAAYPMRSTRQTDANPALVVIRREGELRFLPSASGSIVPWPGRTYVLSDHSVCGRHWPYPAYTPVWMDLRFHAGDDQNVGGKSIDISDPNQSARRIHECFTNSGGL
ncbi:MAG TPA: hypothetical protein VMT88_02680, partial [Actinomycetes bacterium]|nr:hypothetical protein [Actinomycetes bacterium]